MQLQKHLKTKGMGHVYKLLAMALLKDGCYKKHSRGTAMASLQQLILIYYEVLIQYRQHYPTLSRVHYIFVISAEILRIREYAYGCSPIGLICQGYYLCAAVLSYPSL